MQAISAQDFMSELFQKAKGKEAPLPRPARQAGDTPTAAEYMQNIWTDGRSKGLLSRLQKHCSFGSDRNWYLSGRKLPDNSSEANDILDAYEERLRVISG